MVQAAICVERPFQDYPLQGYRLAHTGEGHRAVGDCAMRLPVLAKRLRTRAWSWPTANERDDTERRIPAPDDPRTRRRNVNQC